MLTKKTVCTPSDDGIAFVDDSIRGKVIEFDGNAGYLQLGTNAFNFDAMTFNVWFYWDVDASIWWVRIFDFGKPSDPDPGNHDVNFLTTFAFEDKLRWVLHSDEAAGGVDTILMSLNKIDVKKWTMVTCVHSSTKAELYIDGQLQASKDIGFKASDLVYETNYIGKSNWPDALFKGRMDDMAIYNKALTADEVQALYNSQLKTAIRTTTNNNVNVYTRGGKILAQLPANMKNATMAIYNITGAEVVRIKANTSNVEINVNPGLYLVKVSNGSQTFTSKVLVK